MPHYDVRSCKNRIM